MKRISNSMILLLILGFLVGCSNGVEQEKEKRIEVESSEKEKKKVESTEKKEEENNQSEEEEQKKDILVLDDYEKYIEAYYEFSMKGNPMPPEQRGSAPIPETAGVSNDKYSEIRWGIVDYYGNAFNQGLITEEENNESQKLALAKLNAGDYADSSEKQDIIRITDENVTSYLDEYVRANSSWELSYLSVETAEDGMSKKVYFESQLNSSIRGYFIVTSDGNVSRFSNSGEQLKNLEEIDF